MKKVLLQPFGCLEATRHFHDTIENPIFLTRLQPFVPTKIFEELKKIFPNGLCYVWGIKNGTNKSNISKWVRIEPGDIALFGKNQEYVAKGVVEYKLSNRQLAINLWNIDDDDETWENIFILSNIHGIKIPYKDFNKSVGYKTNFILQGFIVQNDNKSTKAINTFNF